MSSLADAINAKLAASGISATAAARAAGLSLPSFRAALKGKSSPNARSIKKYAKLLAISEDEVLALVGSSSAAKGKKGKAGKKAAKVVKTAGKKRGPKPGKRGPKPGRRAGSQTSGIAQVVELLKQAEALVSDDLAVAVHLLGKSQRATLTAIVKSLS